LGFALFVQNICDIILIRGYQLSTTLLVEKDSRFESIYTLNLKISVGLDIVCKHNAKTAVGFMESNEVSLVIINVAELATDDELGLFPVLNDNKTPFILIGTKKLKVLKSEYQIRSRLDIKTLIRTCAKILGITAQTMTKLAVPKYLPIPLEFFQNLDRTTITIFQKEDGADLYPPIFEVDEQIEKEKIDSLIIKKVTTLYVDNIQRLKLLTLVTQEVVAKLELDKLNADEAAKANEFSQQLVYEKIQKFGITKEAVQISNKTMKGIMDGCNKEKKVKGMVARLLSNKATYQFRHIQVITYVGTHLISNLDWGTPEQIEKFGFIAFFHDLALKTDEQAMVYSDMELETGNFDADEKDIIIRHAQIAAEMIHSYPNAPMGVDTLIRQHHGVTNGRGFTDTFTANLSPMAIIFIIAEYYTHNLLDNIQKDISSAQMITIMKQKFPTARFKRYLEILAKITL
jgi:HD-GYP domain-containing protein (c-di-GMP phosphodiesterase class II)